MLDEYDDIFRDPVGLLPPRQHDHGIPLKDDSSIVKIRSYQYLSVQKNEIEKLVREMLQTSSFETVTFPLLPQ